MDTEEQLGRAPQQDTAGPPAPAQAQRRGRKRQKRRRIAGMTVLRFIANVVLPIAGIVIITGVLVAAPAEDRTLIFLASLVADKLTPR